MKDGLNIALDFLPIVPALLSIVGSSSIVYRVVAKKKEDHQSSPSYSRILLGLSCADIFYSVSILLYGVLLPKEESDHVLAAGNDGTCVALAVISQIGASAWIYNAVLSLYFLCTIVFAMKQETFARRVEPFLHLFAIGYPVAISVVGLALDLFGFWDGIVDVCWVKEPFKAVWLFGPLQLFGTFIIIVLSNISIFLVVRHTLKRTQGSSMRIGDNSNNSSSSDSRIRRVAIQAFLYIAAFLMSYLWIFLIAMAQLYNDGHTGPAIYTLYVIDAFLKPLQGFWNACIYHRPRYLRYCRSDRPELSAAVRWAVFGDNNSPPGGTAECAEISPPVDLESPRPQEQTVAIGCERNPHAGLDSHPLEQHP